jgi:hypothetical protein
MIELYDLGERPPLGIVPPKMHAFVVRQTPGRTPTGQTSRLEPPASGPHRNRSVYRAPRKITDLSYSCESAA